MLVLAGTHDRDGERLGDQAHPSGALGTLERNQIISAVKLLPDSTWAVEHTYCLSTFSPRLGKELSSGFSHIL